MAKFRYIADWETSAHAGAGGMFQIEYLELDGVDVTNRIDQGLHFHEEDPDEFVRYLSRIFNIPVNQIEFENDEDNDYPYK